MWLRWRIAYGAQWRILIWQILTSDGFFDGFFDGFIDGSALGPYRNISEKKIVTLRRRLIRNRMKVMRLVI